MGVETLDVDESLYSILTMINNGTWQISQRFPLQPTKPEETKKAPFQFFSALCDFFRNFFNVSKESPFRHYATFSERKKSKISSFFPKKNVLRFLSLRYSADFRRSRLVVSEQRGSRAKVQGHRGGLCRAE